jgi:hypothetical protein
VTRFVTLSVSSRYAWLAIMATLNAASLAGSRAQEPSSDSLSADRQKAIVSVGIDDIYRPGIWTAIAKPTATQLPEIEQATSVQSLDGDGVRVIYDQPDSPSASSWMYAIPGSANAPLVFRDAENQELFRGTFAGKPIEAKTPWVVVIGDTLGIEDIGRNDLLNREASVAVSKIESSRQLPDHALGLSGVDIVIVCPSGIETLKELSDSQAKAIIDWTHGGGELMISFGKSANEMLAAAPWLSDLLSLPQSLKPIRLDPSALETYTSSQSRLPVLDAVEFPVRGDNVLLAGRNESRQPARIAVKKAVGFGHATIVAVAFDSPELAAWPQRLLFVARLSGELLVSELEVRRDPRVASSSVGYDDIAGQLRMALDRFELRRRIPYSIISIILVALVALIGPLDYLLVNRLFGKPLLGWITFPVTVLAIAGLLIWIGQTPASEVAKGRTAHINRMEIVDIDTKSATPTGRGWSWAHLSSIDALKSDYPATLQPALLTDANTASIVSAPFGHPGSTFGGISIAGEDSRMPPYDVLMSRTPNGSLTVNVKNIPLSPGGSKGIVSQWRFEPKLSGKSKLARRRGSELLEGSLTNPMSVDLLNGALVFGEWVYLLPTRLRAGQTIDSVDSLRQKNFRWLLARREALENSSRSEPWDPEMHDDFSRLAEILMFDSVAGGKDYTGLSNRPLSQLDLGDHLNQETAILFGQLESPALEIDLPVQRASSSAIRIILNVDIPKVAGIP